MVKYLLLLLMPAWMQAQSLPAKLTAYLNTLPSSVTVSLAVESLTDQTSFYHNADDRSPSASIIKLPVMVEAMEQVKAGTFVLTEKHLLTEAEKAGGSGVLQTYAAGSPVTNLELVTLMMTHSDNTATNILIHTLGRDAINRRIKAMGLRQTQLNRIMMDTAAVRRGIENYVTAREMNTLLTAIYRQQVATPALCGQMLDILKQNTDTLTIPRLIPKTGSAGPVAIAHKTGTLAYVRGDAGIVYARRPFVMSVLVRGTTTEKAEQIIGELALHCFTHFDRP